MDWNVDSQDSKSNKSAQEIFGELDAIKVRSCMTLFELVSDNEIFGNVLG